MRAQSWHTRMVEGTSCRWQGQVLWVWNLGNCRAVEGNYADGYPMSIGELLAFALPGRDLDIHPEFQRVYRWGLNQKSALIESILLNIPVPSVSCLSARTESGTSSTGSALIHDYGVCRRVQGRRWTEIRRSDSSGYRLSAFS